jgi:uncharacterized OB-fold protein
MTDQPYNKPIPNVDDPVQGPFWAAAREHRLVAQKCGNCGTLVYPGLQICPSCWERELAWTDVSTEGSIWSYVVYHRAFHPGFSGELPYVVAIVENADGVRYTGRVVGRREDVAVGAKVRAVFADETPEFTLVKWEFA